MLTVLQEVCAFRKQRKTDERLLHRGMNFWSNLILFGGLIPELKIPSHSSTPMLLSFFAAASVLKIVIIFFIFPL
jgi:hypothetical protein